MAKRPEPSPLRKYKSRKRDRVMKDQFDRETESLNALAHAVAEVIKEKHPKIYEAHRFMFETQHPGLTITLSWDELASIMMVTPGDALDKGDFHTAE